MCEEITQNKDIWMTYADCGISLQPLQMELHRICTLTWPASLMKVTKC